MRLRLIAVGDRMPEWVSTAVADYSGRLPREWHFQLVELPVASRGKNADIPRLVAKEGSKMLNAIPAQSTVVAFDERGKQLDTRQWAAQLQGWQQGGETVCLLIGGPDGLAPECLARSAVQWSLSRMTLPHALVRVMVLEQLYRAWSLSCGHPYHRA